jgi:DNA-binding transcriptional MerR regulator
MSEIYLTVSQAARVIGVSANTLRDWHKAGRLVPSGMTPQGWRLYRRAEIEKTTTNLQKENRV